MSAPIDPKKLQCGLCSAKKSMRTVRDVKSSTINWVVMICNWCDRAH